ncbi:MAG: hypothetical protein KDM91_12685 [Verrucomicrobiae bacterium]|nr:hypothetical protein [Verrucomicrobiae bacterium]MCP5542130.1 hypothetical protein [Akkermansiaceae bacterium]MCP5551505.1 hypothetical protein [Akkermansiaceae bacterium]
MKRFSFFPAILCLFLAATAIADDELDHLRLSYHAAVKRAIQAPRVDYVKELNRLIENRTRRSDLDGAVAARDVLEKFSGSPGKKETESPASPDGELDRLRTEYEAASARVIKPLRETYLRELNKILQARTRASDLSGALAVKNEIEKVTEETELEPTDSLEALFVGRTWVSGTGTAFTFAADGKCIRVFRDPVEGIWERRGSVVIASIEGSPNETRYFRFVSKTEAYYGNSEKKMDMPVRPR